MKYLHVMCGCLPLSLKFKLIFANNVQIIYLYHFPPRDISPLISIFVIKGLVCNTHTYLALLPLTLYQIINDR